MPSVQPTQYLTAMGFSTSPEDMARALIEKLTEEETLKIISETQDSTALLGIILFKGEEFYDSILESKYCDDACLEAMWERIDINVINLYQLRKLVAHSKATQKLITDIAEKCKANTSTFAAYLWGCAESPNITSKELLKLWGALDNYFPGYHRILNMSIHRAILSNPNLKRKDILTLDVSKEDDTILRIYEKRLANAQN